MSGLPEGSCATCHEPGGTLRVSEEESPATGDIYVCDGCWSLLRDPKTALPLIRGHLTLTGRQFYDRDELKRRVDGFMERVRKLGPRN